MTENEDLFAKIESLAAESGVESALEFLADHFRTQAMPHQLFEVLKIRTRHRLGLPLLYGDQPDQLDESGKRELEDGLLDACREVGTMLIKNGQLRDGWVYLQPVGDREAAEDLISSVAVNDENIDSLVDIAFAEGAAPEFGYSLVLDKHGTCNAITSMDTRGMQFDKPTRGRLAGLLVSHLYKELTANVRLHIEKEKGSKVVNATAPDASLQMLLDDQPWVTAGGSHHVDATHLASVMRIGQAVEDQESLEKLVEMARYGSCLASDFQYPGNPPFENTYEDHLIFYGALCGRDVDQAVKHFDRKAGNTDAEAHGFQAIETLIELLIKTDRRQQALDVWTEKLAADGRYGSKAYEIAKSDDELENLMTYFRDQDDLLGFSVGALTKVGKPDPVRTMTRQKK